MSPTSSQGDPRLHREIVVIGALTLLGGSLRLWSLGRLGLVHFDEGIYALAGLWVFSPRGWTGLDPTVVAYAPPGFPILVGLAYWCLGVGDLSAILVSIVAGTLTIPAIGWLACRTFGPGAGAAAAACAALSAPHIAFSRMALTDASFLLFWILALGQGHRFLERPNPARAVLLGVSVGVAQLFKYNGWLSGVFVAESAGLWLLFHRAEWSSRTVRATWGWGCLAAAVAAIVYWPWFQFVESHGGYAALLAHHRSYLGGMTSWPGHLSVQLAQENALSGGGRWIFAGGLLAALGATAALGDFRVEPRLLPRILVEALSFAALCLLPHVGWWAALGWIVVFSCSNTRFATMASYLLAVGWATLGLLTPFYHPYPRLFLPLQAFGWLFLGGSFLVIRSKVEVQGRGAGWRLDRVHDPLPWFVAVSLFAAVCQALIPSDWHSKGRFPGPLEPTDSLRQACRVISSDVPKDLRSLAIYARPPVTYYLAGAVTVSPQPSLDRLLRPGASSSWALLDGAMMRQESDVQEGLAALHGRWVVIREAPTVLNLPTLLDIDPAAATSRKWDASAPLLLLRAKPPGDAR